MLKIKNTTLLKDACLIDGKWCAADSGDTLNVDNPATGETIITVPKMGADETTRAIEAAKIAQKKWAQQTAKERCAILRKWFELVMANQEDLAKIMTAEQGKPLAESSGEIAYAASYIEWFAEEGKRDYGAIIPSHRSDAEVLVIKQPVGVVAAITPWNFPAAMITRKVAPALAVGCSIVLKPATQTPLSALALGHLALEAGLPVGLFNIITGSASAIGGVMTASPVIRKLTFTGSTEIGRLLLTQSADTVKKVSMELGGNAPFIVFDDADIEAAIEGVMISKFRNTGQTCVCANRIYVQAGIYDSFVEKLTKAVNKLRIGNGMESDVTQGPLIDMNAVAKMEEHIADALAKGGRVTTGGKRSDLGLSFFEPTLIADATQEMLFAHDETFGPLAPVFKFETEEEVITMANDTEFGLASYFYSRDLGRVWRVAKAIEAGMVAVNSGILSTEIAPFGGIKQSGMGREGSFMGLEDYLEAKYVLMAGL